MKETNKLIEDKLLARGVYRLKYRYNAIEHATDVWSKLGVIIILAIRITYALYYYPHPLKYLLINPISEIQEILGIWLYIALAFPVLLSIISTIIKYRISFKAEKIFCQVYREFGRTPPEFDITEL